MIDFNHRWPAGRRVSPPFEAGPRVPVFASGGVTATAGTAWGWPLEAEGMAREQSLDWPSIVLAPANGRRGRQGLRSELSCVRLYCEHSRRGRLRLANGFARSVRACQAGAGHQKGRLLPVPVESVRCCKRLSAVMP